MVELSSAIMTTFIGMFGVVVGAIISNYVNQKIAAQSARRDLLFQKKVDYFDRTVSAIENNLKLYMAWRKKLEVSTTTATIEKAMKMLKKNRAKFDPLSSALYFDIERFSRDIRQFVAIEKQIFALFDKLKREHPEPVIDALRQSLHRLEQEGQTIINKMRRSLMRE